MSQSQYKLVPITFEDRRRAIVCHASTPGSPLVALFNYLALRSEAEVGSNLESYVEEGTLKKRLAELIEGSMDFHRRSGTHRPQKVLADKESYLRTLETLATATHMNPGNHSCSAFQRNGVLDLCAFFHAPLYHAWLLDPKDHVLSSTIKGRGYDHVVAVLQKMEEDVASGASSSDPESNLARVKDFIDATSDHMTDHGLSVLCDKIKERELVLVYMKNQFRIVHKLHGDLFILETDAHILASIKGSAWKKLTKVEDESFYVTSTFSPIWLQPNADKMKAWWDRKFEELVDEPVDISSKKTAKSKKKSKGTNLSEKMQENEESHNSAHDSSTSNDCFSEKEAETPSNDPASSHSCLPEEEEAIKSKTLAEKFLEFLKEFQGSSSCKAPHFEGVALGMKHTGEFKLYVPYKFIERYDSDLALTIQDEYPSIHDELLGSAVSYLCNQDFDKEAAQQIELEIINVPEPRR